MILYQLLVDGVKHDDCTPFARSCASKYILWTILGISNCRRFSSLVLYVYAAMACSSCFVGCFTSSRCVLTPCLGVCPWMWGPLQACPLGCRSGGTSQSTGHPFSFIRAFLLGRYPLRVPVPGDLLVSLHPGEPFIATSTLLAVLLFLSPIS